MDAERNRRQIEHMPADNRGRADQRGEGIDIRAQHSRYFPEQDIAHHAATDAGERAEENRPDRTDVVRECFIRAGGHEEAETGGVEQQHRAAQLVDEGYQTNVTRPARMETAR